MVRKRSKVVVIVVVSALGLAACGLLADTEGLSSRSGLAPDAAGDPPIDGDAPIADVDGGAPADGSLPERACDLARPFGNPAVVFDPFPAGDLQAHLSRDELTLYFGRRPGGNRDIYIATRSSKEARFGIPTKVVPLSQDDAPDQDPSLSWSGKELFFVRGVDGGATKVFGSEVATGFSTVHLLELGGAADDNDRCPNLSPAGNVLYFSSTRSGGGDVFESRRDAGFSFEAPTPVVAINTDARERCAFLSFDEKTFFFSSNRDGGAGGDDLWIVSGADAATPLAELNTAANEVPSWLSEDGCRLYFESDRDRNDAGEPTFRIYVASRPR